jgi:hypothetical protein
MDARECTDPSQLFLGDTEAAPLRRCACSKNRAVAAPLSRKNGSATICQ